MAVRTSLRASLACGVIIAACAPGLVAADAGGPEDRLRAELARPSGAVTVGDQVVLEIPLEGHPAAAGTTLREVEVLPLEAGGADGGPEEFHLLGSELRDGVLSVRLAPLATGSLTIPSLRLRFRDSSGGESLASTEPVPLEVSSVLGPGETELADIKPPAELRADWRPVLLWGAGVVALAALAAAGVVLWMRRPRKAALPPGIDPLAEANPYEWAVGRIDALLAAGHLEKGEIKKFYVELSAIARLYLWYRYRIPAPERTTSEIGWELSRALIGPELLGEIEMTMRDWDEVKFAGREPGPLDGRSAAARFLAVLDRTRPLRQAEPPAAGAPGAG